MKEPLRARYAPGYDLFKLIVAVILTIILIVLLLRERDRQFASLAMNATQAVAEALAPTATFPAVPTSTAAPETTETLLTKSPVTETPAVVEATAAEAAATETPPTDPQTASDSSECPANPTRIQVGMTVRVLDWLNFRAGPGLGKTVQIVNRPGTQMEVVGGPVCTDQGGNPPRAYLWWNVRMEDGREGWSAEAPLNFPNYFLEPVP